MKLAKTAVKVRRRLGASRLATLEWRGFGTAAPRIDDNQEKKPGESLAFLSAIFFSNFNEGLG